MNADITPFFHEPTGTVTYVVADSKNKACAIIDSVLDYDSKSGRTSTVSADDVITFIRKNKFTPQWILETHAHADHLSAARYLKEHLGAKTGIGARIPVVQQTFAEIFNVGPDFPRDGSQWDRVFEDGDTAQIGDATIEAIHMVLHHHR